MNLSTKSFTRLTFSSRADELKNAESIGVALGPGLPMGFVGVGMLMALKELKISVSIVSGTSIGSIIGALYACGLTPEEIREHAIEFVTQDAAKTLISQDRKPGVLGLSTGEKLMDDLRRRAGWDPEFYELKVPLFIVAADKESQKSVILRHGNVFDAVRASIALPFTLEEQEIGGMKLADGAIFCPLDTEVLYSEGADFVIAMQAKPIRSTTNRKLPLRTKLQPRVLKKLGWETDEQVYFAKPGCDILLRPRVPIAFAKDLSRIGDIIDLGIKSTYEAIIEIEKGNFKARVVSDTDKLAAEAAIERLNVEAEEKVAEFQNYLVDMEKQAAEMSDAELMAEFPKFAKKFGDFYASLTEKFADPVAASEALRASIKGLAQLVDQSPFMSRCLHKPRGYAGDYQMMNYMYDNEVFDSQSNMGKLLNYFLFSNPAANAVRNRAKIVQGLVQQQAALKEELSLASIACGPAREVAGTMKLLVENSRLKKVTWTLFDQDDEALGNAKQNLPKDRRLVPKFITAGVRDLLKKTVDLGPQDIIYSLGLFDYLEDKVAITVINRLYEFLNEGGLMLIGNFHTSNPSRALIEGAMKWFLIHRTEEEQLELGKKGASDARHFVMAEPEGINLILVTSKPKSHPTT